MPGKNDIGTDSQRSFSFSNLSKAAQAEWL